MRRGEAPARRATKLVVGALILAAAAGSARAAPSPWGHAQASVHYALFVPTTTAGLRLTSFQRVSCGDGRDPGVAATYGSVKGRGFSVTEGSPDVCLGTPGYQAVTTRVLGGVRISVGVFCQPTRHCTLQEGEKTGYVLRWRRAAGKGSAFARAHGRRTTDIFLQSFRLPLPTALAIAAGFSGPR